MKKLLILVSASALVFSCKKNTSAEFSPTDVTGTTIVRGNVSKNIITPNGSGGYTNTSLIPAANINVGITINKSALYPNSTAQGADVYSGTTDANGNYAITVKSNASGVPAKITIDGYAGTLDTIVNGQKRTGLYTTYTGTTTTATLFMGQNFQFDHKFDSRTVSSNPNTINAGSATITGSISALMMKQVSSGTLTTLTTTNVPLANHKVYLSLTKDPNTLMTRTYEATTNDQGYYSFNVATVPVATPGFTQDAVVFVNDYATTRDTITTSNSVKTGRAGVFRSSSINVNGVYNNTIKNANHITYSNFTAN